MESEEDPRKFGGPLAERWNMTEPKSSFKISLPPAGPGGRIELDGEDISDKVRAVYIGSDVTDRTRVWLEYVNCEVDVEGQGNVT